jgi:hypothetical protein
MPEETSASPSPDALPDIENLADSDDPEVIEARAKLLRAQATLTKASTPLFDKIVLRGLVPIALALVTPWAIYTFDAAQTEQVKQGEVLVKLEKLLSGAKKDAAAQKVRSAAWRVRMGELEKQRTEELKTMTSMVNRLDSTMKTALIHMAVAKILSSRPQTIPKMDPMILPTPPPSRKEVMADVATQIQLPGAEDDEIRKLAGRAYDRIMQKK